MLDNFIKSLMQPEKIFWLVIGIVVCVIIYQILKLLSKGLSNLVEILQNKKIILYASIAFISLFITFYKTTGKEEPKQKSQNMLVKMISETIEDATTQVTATVKPK